MWSIDRRVGKLVEIRIWSPVTLEETVLRTCAIVDLALATVFPPDVVQGNVTTMKNEPNLVRSSSRFSA